MEAWCAGWWPGPSSARRPPIALSCPRFRRWKVALARSCAVGSRKPQNAVAKLSVWALRYLRLESKLPSRARVRARRDDGSDFEGSVSDYVIDDAWAAVEAGHPVDVRPSAALLADLMRLTNCRSRVGGASRDVGWSNHEHLPRSGAGECSLGSTCGRRLSIGPVNSAMTSWNRGNHVQSGGGRRLRPGSAAARRARDHSFEAAELKLS